MEGVTCRDSYRKWVLGGGRKWQITSALANEGSCFFILVSNLRCWWWVCVEVIWNGFWKTQIKKSDVEERSLFQQELWQVWIFQTIFMRHFCFSYYLILCELSFWLIIFIWTAPYHSDPAQSWWKDEYWRFQCGNPIPAVVIPIYVSSYVWSLPLSSILFCC